MCAYGALSFVALSRMHLFDPHNVGCVTQQKLCAVSHSTHACCGQLCHAADLSAVWRSRHVCCVTQQRCLLCDTADMFAVHVCCITQQTCLLWDTAAMSVSCSEHVCCVTQQTRLLCHTADRSAVFHSRHVCCETQQFLCASIHVCRRGAKTKGAQLLVGVVDADPRP